MLDLPAGGTRQALLTSMVIGPVPTTWLTLPHIGALKPKAPLVQLLAFGVKRVADLAAKRPVWPDVRRKSPSACAKPASLADGRCVDRPPRRVALAAVRFFGEILALKAVPSNQMDGLYLSGLIKVPSWAGTRAYRYTSVR